MGGSSTRGVGGTQSGSVGGRCPVALAAAPRAAQQSLPFGLARTTRRDCPLRVMEITPLAQIA
jgi:hypothetical protein